MSRFWLQSCVLGAVLSVCGSTTPAQAQWVYGYPTYSYSRVVVSPVVVAPRPYVVYSAPVVTPVITPVVYNTYYDGYGWGGYPVGISSLGGYGYGYGYGYGPAPLVMRSRYNYGLFGHPNYHYHARGPGYGHYHAHYRMW